MADTTTANAKVPAPAPANGTAPTADAAKAERKPREVPMIAINASKDEYAEVKGALGEMLANAGGVVIDVPLGPFVLAHALKSIRATKASKVK